jgi:hypothetical protein
MCNVSKLSTTIYVSFFGQWGKKNGVWGNVHGKDCAHNATLLKIVYVHVCAIFQVM